MVTFRVANAAWMMRVTSCMRPTVSRAATARARSVAVAPGGSMSIASHGSTFHSRAASTHAVGVTPSLMMHLVVPSVGLGALIWLKLGDFAPI